MKRLKIASLWLVAIFLLSAYNAQAADTYFRVATKDVADAVSHALTQRGAADKVRVIVFSSNLSLYEANKPLSVAIQALTFDKDSQKWQANMHILSNGQTVTVMPIQGRYEVQVSVPVLTRIIQNSDVIAENDIAWKDMGERQIRKDTVLKAEDMIGRSPLRAISPNRSVRLSELKMPALVKKGDEVGVTYSAPNMTIRTVARALEDGSKGGLVRVQNLESKQAFTARVISENQVEVNMHKTMTN